MTDYQTCPTCKKYFSLEQADLCHFCPYCGEDLWYQLEEIMKEINK